MKLLQLAVSEMARASCGSVTRLTHDSQSALGHLVLAYSAQQSHAPEQPGAATLPVARSLHPPVACLAETADPGVG